MNKQAIVAKANEVRGRLNGEAKQILKIVRTNDVVWAVWPDLNEPDGVGMTLIKGIQLMREVIASNASEMVRWVAIPCIDANQAEALRLVAGEKDKRH